MKIILACFIEGKPDIQMKLIRDQLNDIDLHNLLDSLANALGIQITVISNHDKIIHVKNAPGEYPLIFLYKSENNYALLYTSKMIEIEKNPCFLKADVEKYPFLQVICNNPQGKKTDVAGIIPGVNQPRANMPEIHNDNISGVKSGITPEIHTGKIGSSGKSENVSEFLHRSYQRKNSGVKTEVHPEVTFRDGKAGVIPESHPGIATEIHSEISHGVINDIHIGKIGSSGKSENVSEFLHRSYQRTNSGVKTEVHPEATFRDGKVGVIPESHPGIATEIHSGLSHEIIHDIHPEETAGIKPGNISNAYPGPKSGIKTEIMGGIKSAAQLGNSSPRILSPRILSPRSTDTFNKKPPAKTITLTDNFINMIDSMAKNLLGNHNFSDECFVHIRTAVEENPELETIGSIKRLINIKHIPVVKKDEPKIS